MKPLGRDSSQSVARRLGHAAASILGATSVLGILLLGLSTTAKVAIAAKPAPPPPPPPVYYDVNVLGNGAGLDMNEFGTIVGTSPGGGLPGVATVYYLGGVGAVNLNIGASLIDLDSATQVAVPIQNTDWIAVRATGINVFGEIVGIAENLDGDTRAFHFDSATSLMRLLPGSIYTTSAIDHCHLHASC